jgi:hypothetical protein
MKAYRCVQRGGRGLKTVQKGVDTMCMTLNINFLVTWKYKYTWRRNEEISISNNLSLEGINFQMLSIFLCNPYIIVYSNPSKVLLNLFNDPKYSEIKFKIENKHIYCHKVILRSRCEHFRSMLSENWSINSSKKIEITQYSYSVYYWFLKYLYTDCVHITNEEMIGLMNLANSYFEENLN